jgi:hypothetical protein
VGGRSKKERGRRKRREEEINMGKKVDRSI